jgi:Tol biopolymer transport system component
VQVTSVIGVEDHPAWSADSRLVMYAATADADLYGGDWNIWVAPTDGGPPVNRTPDHTGDDRFPNPSPDGRSVAFWSDREGGGLFVMSALGGAAVRVADAVLPIVQRHRTAWSPDGSQLAFVDHASGSPVLAIVEWPGGNRRTLSMDGDTAGRFDLAWSPDGRFVVYADHVDPNSDLGRLWLLRLDDGVSVPVTDGASNDRSPTWRGDSLGIYFASNRGGPMDVWHLALAADGTALAPAVRLTTGLEVQSVSASPDGRRIAYSKGRRVSNAWRVPVGSGSRATWADAEQLTFDQAFIEFVETSRDGRQMLFSSDRSGGIQIWGGRPGEGGFPRQVTFSEEPSWSPRFSPDGSRIAFYALRDGHRAIFTMPAAGGPRTPHTGGAHMDVDPSWSPDARTLVFTSDRTGNFDVWTVDLETGLERPVTTHPALEWFPHWSPDGRRLVFRSDRGDESRLWLLEMPVAGEDAPQRLTTGVASASAWAPDGRTVYYRGERDFWAVSLDDRSERPVTDFGAKRGNPGSRSLATDGRDLYFTWEEGLGDIWVMDVESESGAAVEP